MTHSGAMANFLYAADFRKGRVAVYDTNFHRVGMGDDAFEDEELPRGYAPFNVQNIGGDLYVAFAQQGSGVDEVDGAGLGYVDVFSTSGRLLAPAAAWELAQLPLGHDAGAQRLRHIQPQLLVGQFGSGQIAAYDAVSGRFKGLLNDATDKPITIDGLWDIAFGSGGALGAAPLEAHPDRQPLCSSPRV